ncbi:MAG: hypothetical protein J6I80_04030, partial [Clostridia bacterium]|nr:hypothetical protein [Clostridia bacterium]
MAENENSKETFTTTLPVNNANFITVHRWEDGEMDSITGLGVKYGDSSEKRTYLSLENPQFPQSVSIKKAQLIFDCYTGDSDAAGKIAMYNVTGAINHGICT